MAKAVAGVVLAGGALGAIFWWNHVGYKSPLRSASAEAVPSEAHAPAPAAPGPSVLSTPDSTSRAQSIALNMPAGLNGRADLSVSAAQTPAPTTQAAPSAPAVPGVPNPQALAAGKQLFDAGKLVEGREALNNSLRTGAFATPEDKEAAKALIRKANDTLVFSPTVAAGDNYVEMVKIKPGDRLTAIANIYYVPYELLLKINGMTDPKRVRTGQSLKMIKGPFHAVVDKRAFTLDLYLNSPGGPDSMYITTFRVGLGKDDSTPVGVWKVAQGNKLSNPTYYSPRGEGVIHAGDPANPLGKFWIGLTGIEGGAVGKTSYGIHGTIYPDSIGKMESMGCIRLGDADIAQLYQMLYEVKSTIKVVD